MVEGDKIEKFLKILLLLDSCCDVLLSHEFQWKLRLPRDF